MIGICERSAKKTYLLWAYIKWYGCDTIALVWSTVKTNIPAEKLLSFMFTSYMHTQYTYLNVRLRSLSPVHKWLWRILLTAHYNAHATSMNSRDEKRTDEKKMHLKNLQYRRKALNFLWIRSCIFVIIAIYSWFKRKMANFAMIFFLSCKSLAMLWPDSHILWTCSYLFNA